MRKDTRRRRLQREQERPGRVEDLSQARLRRKKQKIRKLLLWAVPLALLLVWFIARNSAALVSAGDFVETLQINSARGQGLPQNTGISELYQWQEMTGGFVALGKESCVFYNDKGVRMRSIQAGYARPAISAGDTRFVLYNRGGTELRVESRTKNLYTKSDLGGILLCEMSPEGSLAVVTEDPRYTAKLLVYPSSMEQPLTWKLTSTEGVPLSLAFSENEKKLAVVTITAKDGKNISQLYILDRSRPRQEQTPLAIRENGVPLASEWIGDTLVVAYSNGVVTYQEKKGETGKFEWSGESLIDFSMLPSGKMALLLSSGASAEIVLLDKNLKETGRIGVESGNGVALTKNGVYLYTNANVVCYSLKGEYAWHYPCNLRPQGLLPTRNGLLLFQGGIVEECIPPASE